MERIQGKESEVQEGINQAGLSFQLAKVELESRQTSVQGSTIGTPVEINTHSPEGLS